MKKWRSLLSLLLCTAMIISMVSGTTLAEELKTVTESVNEELPEFDAEFGKEAITDTEDMLSEEEESESKLQTEMETASEDLNKPDAENKEAEADQAEESETDVQETLAAKETVSVQDTAESESEAQTEAKTELEPGNEVRTEAEAEAETEPESEAQTEAEVETDSEVEIDSEAETDPEDEVRAESEEELEGEEELENDFGISLLSADLPEEDSSELKDYLEPNESGYCYVDDYKQIRTTLTKDRNYVAFSFSQKAFEQKGITESNYYKEVYCLITPDSVLSDANALHAASSAWTGNYTPLNEYVWAGNICKYFSFNTKKFGSVCTIYIDEEAFDENTRVEMIIGIKNDPIAELTFLNRDGSVLVTKAGPRDAYSIYDVPEPSEKYYAEGNQYYLFSAWYDQNGIILDKYYESGLRYSPTYEKGCSVTFTDSGKILNADNLYVVFEGAEISAGDDAVKAAKNALPIKEGYEFLGWADVEDGSMLGEKPVTKNLVYEAKWLKLETAEKAITFHRMTDTDELVDGAHYIITGEAVATDDNGYSYSIFTSNPNTLYCSTIMQAGSGDTIVLPADSDMVLTAKKASVSTTTDAAAKFEAVNGQMLKIGTDVSDLTPMFNEKGGTISLACYDSKWKIYNSNRNLELKDNEFYVRYHGYSAALCIWTDAEVVPEEEDPAEEVTYVLDQEVYSYAYTEAEDNSMLFVYTADDGISYALTVDGAVPVTKTSVNDGYGGTTYAITTQKKNAWKPHTGWWSNSYSEVDGDYSVVSHNCFEQQGKYLALQNGALFDDVTQPVYIDQDFNACTMKEDFSGFEDLEKAHVYMFGFYNELLSWDNETKSFVLGADPESSNVCNVEVYRVKYIPETHVYYRLDTIEQIANAEKLVIAIKDPASEDENARIVIASNGSGSNGSTQGYVSEDGMLFVADNSPYYDPSFEFTAGTVDNKGDSYVKFSSLSLGKGVYYYPNKLNSKGTLLGTEVKDVRIVQDKETGAVYLRGNGDSYFLSYSNEKGFTTVNKDSDEKVAVEIYGVTKDESLVVVYYHNTSGVLAGTAYAGDTFTPVTLGNLEKDGKTTYAFVGWTTDDTLEPFLSLEDSCDLYDYDDATETGSIKQEVKDKYSIIGNCNPDHTDVVETAPLVIGRSGNAEIHLYPVYAVRGFESVVTADDGDTAIVGISDWKAIQDEESQYKNEAKEKWLGKINVEVYKDGELWVKSTPMYFSYHNDDAADVNVKFIWDELVEAKSGADPMYSYLSDVSLFPEYDQKGHYVIDCVYAMQGGSEDGLKYKLNWMTEHGGQLDNVQGGSTIRLYVTNIYNAVYYLDDEEITDEKWVNNNVYTTSETDDKFNADAKDAEYKVTATTLTGLMDRRVEAVDGDQFFNSEELARAEYHSFSYKMAEYPHVISIAETPEQLVAEGRALISSSWSLKDKEKNELEAVAFGSDYVVSKDTKGNAYPEDVMEAVPEALAPKTYHLYAYTAEFNNDKGPKKDVTETEPETENTETETSGGDETSAPVTETSSEDDTTAPENESSTEKLPLPSAGETTASSAEEASAKQESSASREALPTTGSEVLGIEYNNSTWVIVLTVALSMAAVILVMLVMKRRKEDGE